MVSLIFLNCLQKALKGFAVIRKPHTSLRPAVPEDFTAGSLRVYRNIQRLSPEQRAAPWSLHGPWRESLVLVRALFVPIGHLVLGSQFGDYRDHVLQLTWRWVLLAVQENVRFFLFVTITNTSLSYIIPPLGWHWNKFVRPSMMTCGSSFMSSFFFSPLPSRRKDKVPQPGYYILQDMEAECADARRPRMARFCWPDVGMPIVGVPEVAIPKKGSQARALLSCYFHGRIAHYSTSSSSFSTLLHNLFLQRV